MHYVRLPANKASTKVNFHPLCIHVTMPHSALTFELLKRETFSRLLRLQFIFYDLALNCFEIHIIYCVCFVFTA